MELKQKTVISGVSREQLLIVPYGIETNNCQAQIYFATLLIVPYGIETNLNLLNENRMAESFNRTLWN